jgi:hypothetical protein
VWHRTEASSLAPSNWDALARCLQLATVVCRDLCLLLHFGVKVSSDSNTRIGDRKTDTDSPVTNA